MGKKKANERGSGDHLGSRKEGGGGGGVADAAAEAEQLAEEQKIARAVKSGGVRTTNAALQNRLNLLVELAKRNDIKGFVRVFVPHDLTEEDTAYYAGELEGDSERWKLLGDEIALLADGGEVFEIVGDQRTRAEYRYLMPNQSLNITREVVFVCSNGDWRAEG